MKRMSSKFKAIFILAGFFCLLPFVLKAEPASGMGNDKEIKDITQKVFPSVVKVEARNATKKVATGVVWDKDGLIVTTALVSPRDGEIFVTDSEGTRFKAKFLGMDSMTHLAVVKVSEKKFAPVSQGSSRDVSPGSWIGVVSLSPENAPAVTQGIVSSVGQDKLRLNVWVVPGSSGSPVVDSKGKMVGLLRGIYSDEKPVVFEFREKKLAGSGYVFSKAEAPSSGMALAVPVDVVKEVVSQIEKKGKVERGWLGVFITEDEEGQIEVVNVEKDSPAELSGLKEGDRIVEFDGKRMASTEMLAREIRMRKPGENVVIKIIRDKKSIDIRVKLGEYTAKDLLEEFEVRFPRLFPSPPAPPIKAPKPPEVPKLKEFEWHWESQKYIGLYLEELNDELSSYFGMEEGRGLLVSKVVKDSPSEKAGLKVGDVIVKAESKKVETVEELVNLIQKKEKGEKIKIEFLRDRKKKTVDVEVEEEERGGRFFGENWDEYRNALKEYQLNLRRQLNGWRDVNAKKYKERIVKMNKELEKISEQAFEKAVEKSKEAREKLVENVKKYKGIRV